MNKIVLTAEEIERVFSWRDKHPEFVRSMPNPLSRLRIICKESGIEVNGTREADRLRLKIYAQNRSCGMIEFKKLPLGYAKLMKDTTKFSEDEKNSVLCLWCTLMAMMVYGDVGRKATPDETESDDRQKKTSGKKKPYKRATDHVTYILRKETKSHTSSHKGSHSKKSGRFSVRGHFRHYKSGKVVWIEEFMKGSGAESERTYKLEKGKSNGKD